MGRVISIVNGIRGGDHHDVARLMIENGISLKQIRKNYAERYRGAELPEKFVKSHSVEHWRAFRTWKETPVPDGGG